MRRRKLLSLADLAYLIQLPLIGLAAWILPQPAWPGLARRIGSVTRRSGVRDLAERLSQIPDPPLDPATPRVLAERLNAHRIEHYFQVMRAYRPGGGWHPDVALSGRAHLDQALADGQGAILWIAHFVYNGLLPKMVLAQAGYPIAHLSRPEHGFSKTAFGIRVLNPVRTVVENRYLDGRIMIRNGHEDRAVRQAARRLAGGGIVSITAGAWEGRRVLQVPCMGGTFPLATGGPALARLSGAPLLPVFVARPDDTRAEHFDLMIDAPIPRPEGVSRAQAIAAMCRTYGQRLQSFAQSHPDQWRGWNYLSRA